MALRSKHPEYPEFYMMVLEITVQIQCACTFRHESLYSTLHGVYISNLTRSTPSNISYPAESNLTKNLQHGFCGYCHAALDSAASLPRHPHPYSPEHQGQGGNPLSDLSDARRTVGASGTWLRLEPAQPISTAIYSVESTLEFTTRMAKLLAKRANMPVYVGCSINLGGAAMSLSVEEEMEAFRAIVDVVTAKLKGEPLVNGA
ncbi:hypothetical protein Landi51_11732 [Colletotrichum acutatum]